MLKNATIFVVDNQSANYFPLLSASVEAHEFMPLSGAASHSEGWAPPRGEENGALCEFVQNGAVLLHVCETKKVPPAVLKKELKAQCELIQAQTGRKPGKAKKAELKEEILDSLMPRAFSKITRTPVFYDRETQLIWIGSTSPKCTDAIATLLVRSINGLHLSKLSADKPISLCMSAWLQDMAAPEPFQLGTSLALKHVENSKAKASYNALLPTSGEINSHIQTGMEPTKLTLDFGDAATFTLSHDFTLSRISMQGTTKDADGFDGNWLIFTSTMREMLPALAEAVGGISSPAKED